VAIGGVNQRERVLAGFPVRLQDSVIGNPEQGVELEGSDQLKGEMKGSS
jgi:hypothetical protein